MHLLTMPALSNATLDLSVEHIPGAGAAGGMGAGLLAFLHATLRPGAEIVLNATRLAQQLESANLVQSQRRHSGMW